MNKLRAALNSYHKINPVFVLCKIVQTAIDTIVFDVDTNNMLPSSPKILYLTFQLYNSFMVSNCKFFYINNWGFPIICRQKTIDIIGQ